MDLYRYLDKCLSTNNRLNDYENTWTKGHSLHINEGRFHRFNNAAWNWNGMYNTAIVTSARARFPIYRFITVRILRPLAEINGMQKNNFYI